jgi:hypothetical protein
MAIRVATCGRPALAALAIGLRLLEPKVTLFSYADMGKRRLSDQERKQLERDQERFRFGTQGPASAVRKVDLASVDTAALVAQIERQPLAPSRASGAAGRKQSKDQDR